jgi:hypothetical protein
MSIGKIALHVRTIGSIVFLLLVARFVYYYRVTLPEYLKTNGASSIFRVSKDDYGYIYGEYYPVSKKKHPIGEQVANFFKYYEDEYFKMLFDIKDSTHYLVLFDQPLLMNEKAFGKTISTINKRDSNGYHFVEFGYVVKNKTYSRCQMVDEKQTVCENCKYLVKYKFQRPEIAYIFLDSLINQK